jgi:hypothetical protein
VRADFLIAELSHIFRGVLLCQHGPVSAWCCVIMALCRHGAVSTWHCVGITMSSWPCVGWYCVIMALCWHSAVSLWPCVGWCCVNMAVCRHSAVSSWPCVSWCCVIMALCWHSAVSLWPCVGWCCVDLAVCRHSAVSTWHFVGIALCHRGPVLTGAVSTWCDFLDCWNLNIQINSSLDSDLSSYHSVQNILSSCLLSRDKTRKLYCTVINACFYMGVKLGLLHWEMNIGWGCSRIWYWGGYLGLRSRKWQETGENDIMRSFMIVLFTKYYLLLAYQKGTLFHGVIYNLV